MMSGLVGQIRVWVLAVIAVALLPASVHAQTPGIYVTPDGGSAVTVNTNTSGYTAQFTVEFIGSGGGIEEDFEFINLSCSGQLGITCSVSQSSVILMSQQTASITVTFNTSSSTGSAQVRLYASGTFYSDDGYRNYTVQSNESVAVTALSVPTSVLQYTDSVVATYRVQRTGGSGSKYFSFACTWGGGSCTRSPTGYSIAAGGYKDVTVTFDAGDIPNNYTLRLDATATGLSAYKSSTVAVSEFVSVNAVATRSPVYVKPNVPDTIDLFSVRFPGQTGSSFSLSVNCSGGIAGCSVAVATTVSVGDTPVVVPVRFTGGANGNQSTITLTATKVGNSAVTASESLEVVSTNQIILTVDDANPGLEQMRGECLNISAGPGAIVCDDYQFVYPFTPVTRMNKTRQIGLIYNSSLIAPWGVVGANFVVPPGPPEPDSVKATLVVNGTTVRTQSYPSSAYQPGEKRRIAFDWSWSGVPDNTQVVPFTISLEPWVGGVAQTPITASHHLISLNKRFVFGRGWWLAGYENVVPRTVSGLGNVLVWTGGDTSGRVYLPAGTNRWVAWSRSRPDTITTTGSEYVRKLIGGGEVRFNSSGYHTKTVDRNGNETIITHGTFNGHVRPTSIQLPTSTGPETVYQLQYDGATGQLEAVQVISATGAWDTYNVHTRPYSSTVFFIDSISAPDGLTTRFETSWGFLDAITDPLGVRTAIGSYYQKVRKITVQSSDYPDIVMWYQPATTLGRVSTGYWGPRVVEDLYSYWDGPRTDVSDISRFFVTGWGAIRGTRDALGNETWIDRGDTNYPAFPTRVRHANGRQVLTSYGPDGLADFVTDRSTGGTTRYVWNMTWSRPESIISPLGVRTDMTYDVKGNRRTVTLVGGGQATFNYDADGLMDWFDDGMGHRTSLSYDGDGNLKEQDPPGLGWTRYSRDQTGRVTKRVTPIDSVGSTFDSTVVTIHYDAMGRDTLQETVNSRDVNWVRVRTTFDSLGRRTSVTPWTYHASRDSSTTGSSVWTYDGLGRVSTETHGLDGGRDSLVYDLGGQVIEQHTRRGHILTMDYDELGRLKKRIVPSVTYPAEAGMIVGFPYVGYPGNLTIPADTATFSYDVIGNLRTANNRYARITRTYFLDGLVETDSLDVDSFRTGIGSTYDLDRRRVAIHHPTTLSPGSDVTAYRFDDAGRLRTIVDPLSNAATFTYNDDGQLVLKQFPGVGLDSVYYNTEHLVNRRSVRTASKLYLWYAPTYDHRGLTTSADRSMMEYSGLGQLKYMDQTPISGSPTEQWFFPDGLAQNDIVETRSRVRGNDVQSKWDHSYSDGRLVSKQEEWINDLFPTEPIGWVSGRWGYSYDSDGNRDGMFGFEYRWTEPTDPVPAVDKVSTHRFEGRSYYSADNKLRFNQLNRDTLNSDDVPGYQSRHGSFDEHRYDALGRRVYTYSTQSGSICNRPEWCSSYLDRYVWDGNQVLWETRGANTVGYVHGGVVDEPVELIRNGQAVYLHTGWRGLYSTASDAWGSQVGCMPDAYSGCDDIAWPAGDASATLRTDPRKTPVWYGSLVVAQRDGSGLLYRRARYYDPETGQFTQEDPIGIAGGLNLYGYANGDPINFSDPFGLCAPWCVGAAVGFGLGVVSALASDDPFWSWQTLGKVGTSTLIGGLSGGLSVLPQTAVRGGFVVAAGQMGLGAIEGMAMSAIDGDFDSLGSDALKGAFVGIMGEVGGNIVGTLASRPSNFVGEAARYVDALQAADLRIRDVEKFTQGLAELLGNAYSAKVEGGLAGFAIGLIALIADNTGR